MTRKRRTWLVLLACVAVGIALFALLAKDDEPRYEGRTLSSWLIDASPINPSRTPYDGEVEAAIRAIGTNGIPYLLEWITYEPKPDRSRGIVRSAFDRLPNSVIQRIPALQSWLHFDDELGRAECVPMAFGTLGPTAAPAIPGLTDLLTEESDPEVFRRALGSLAGISTDAAPLVMRYLAGPHEARRTAAMYAYANSDLLRTNAEPAVPLLLQSLQHTNSAHERIWTVITLDNISVSSNQIVGPLTQALHDSHPGVRRLATHTLQRIAPEVLTNAPPQ